MHRRLILAGLSATGGLVTTAFLQVAVAAADPVDVSATGADAFTIGDYTFDPLVDPTDSPGVEGWDLVPQLATTPPLLEIGGGDVGGFLPSAPQNFEVYDPTTGTALGAIDTNETVTNLFGLTNAEFTVTAANGPSDLPTVGSVYDVFNLGHGYDNVYTAIPGIGGAPDTVTDVLVTPNGSEINLDSLFGSIDAAAPMQPGDAFTGLETGDSSIGADAFSIGGVTLDPTLSGGGEGFETVAPFTSTPPLLEIGGAGVGNPDIAGDDFALQSFNLYSGDSTSTEVGTITAAEDVTNLLGFTNTQLIVTSATATGDGSAADLPTQGTVYDAINLGNGYENVYTATPGSDGTVTDTLVTPHGDINLDSLFGGIDAAAPMQPGDAFTGLEAGDSSIGADAFSIGDTTFDPTLAGGGEGYDTVYQIIGAPPLLEIGGGTGNLGGGLLFPIDTQDFNVYDGTGASATEVGSIAGNEGVTNLLGLTNTEFSVESVTVASGADASDLPTVGSVYDVLNLGDGIENVYTAVPGVDGAADTVTDTLVTKWGDLNLDSLFGGVDAVSLLNPGDAFTGGLDAASAAVSSIDPLSFLGL
jgi:hypothetical protein